MWQGWTERLVRWLERVVKPEWEGEGEGECGESPRSPRARCLTLAKLRGAAAWDAADEAGVLSSCEPTDAAREGQGEGAAGERSPTR